MLFIGVAVWKSNADAAGFIIKAARGYQKMNGLATAGPLPVTV